MRQFLVFMFILVLSQASKASTYIDVNKIAASVESQAREDGTLYFKLGTSGKYIAAPQFKADVVMNISGPIVRTKITQYFHNASNHWLEGVYTYPLPKGSAVDTLKMKVGKRLIKGIIKEKEQAKKAYTKALREGRKASIVKQHRPNIFSTSVANIGPGETIEITIEYQDIITPRDGEFEMRFPMTIRPRFSPGTPLGSLPTGHGWGLDTDEVPDASQVTPFYEAPIRAQKGINVSVYLDAGFQIGKISSKTHTIMTKTKRKGVHLITLGDVASVADKDFVLNWAPKPAVKPAIGLFSQKSGATYNHLIMVMPRKSDKSTVEEGTPPRIVTFILDKSGSMSGTAMAQAKSAVSKALNRLGSTDKFNLILFDSSANSLFQQPKFATLDNVNQAQSLLDRTFAGGGTHMSAALSIGLPVAMAEDGPKLSQVIFVTDGAVSNEAGLMGQIKLGIGNSRLFTVGIGSAPNNYFMSEAAHAGRGAFVNINNNNDIDAPMSKLFSMLEKPVLTNIKVKWPKGFTPSEVFPKKIPDLYDGEPIVILIKSKKPLKGSIGIQSDTWNKTFKTKKILSKGKGIDKLFGRTKIKHINRSFYGKSASEKKAGIRPLVLQTALEYGLVSKYTSLVAIDTKVSRKNTESPIFTRNVPNALPSDMPTTSVRTMMKTLPSSNFNMRIRSVAKPSNITTPQVSTVTYHARSTATNGPLYQLISIILFAMLMMLSLMMWRSKQNQGEGKS